MAAVPLSYILCSMNTFVEKYLYCTGDKQDNLPVNDIYNMYVLWHSKSHADVRPMSIKKFRKLLKEYLGEPEKNDTYREILFSELAYDIDEISRTKRVPLVDKSASIGK